MKWFLPTDLSINYNNKGVLKDEEPWISTEEYVLDSGHKKQLKELDMLVTVSPKFYESDTVYLHFRFQRPEEGIIIGYINED